MLSPSVRLFATPWTVACHAPLSMRFSRQQYWSGLPFPPPGDLPDSRIESRLLYLLHCRQILHQLSHRGSPKLPRDKPIWRISCAGNLLCSLSRVQKKEMEWGRGQRAGRFPRGHWTATSRLKAFKEAGGGEDDKSNEASLSTLGTRACSSELKLWVNLGNNVAANWTMCSKINVKLISE